MCSGVGLGADDAILCLGTRGAGPLDASYLCTSGGSGVDDALCAGQWHATVVIASS
jgi:hypothetical protein